MIDEISNGLGSYSIQKIIPGASYCKTKIALFRRFFGAEGPPSFRNPFFLPKNDLLTPIVAIVARVIS